MENITKFVRSWSYSQESAANRTTGVYGNPHLMAGLLLGYFLLGLITVIMAFWSQHRKLRCFKESIILIFKCQKFRLRAIQIIHEALFTLLFMDIINSVTAIVLAVHLILGTCGSACEVVSIVWFLSKSSGIVLHLLCALMSVLHLCNPHLRDHLRIITNVLFLLTILFIPLYHHFPLVGLIGLAVITFGLALVIIAKSLGSTVWPSAAASKRWIVFVAMFTFLVIYLPTFVLDCLTISSTDASGVEHYLMIYTNLLFGTNIQLVLDGILCFLILRLPAEVKEEEEQQHPQYGIEIQPPHTFQNPYFK